MKPVYNDKDQALLDDLYRQIGQRSEEIIKEIEKKNNSSAIVQVMPHKALKLVLNDPHNVLLTKQLSDLYARLIPKYYIDGDNNEM